MGNHGPNNMTVIWGSKHETSLNY